MNNRVTENHVSNTQAKRLLYHGQTFASCRALADHTGTHYTTVAKAIKNGFKLKGEYVMEIV